MRRPRSPSSDPLVIQIYIPTEYIPTIHSAHVMIQMLLALHSKINIFTQNKGINNLRGLKSLQIQSSYDSALILSFHCTSLSALPQPQPACLPQKGTSRCLPGPGCHTMSSIKGKALLPGGIQKHTPHSNWACHLHSGSSASLMGCPPPPEDRTGRIWIPDAFALGEHGPLTAHFFWRLVNIKDLGQGCQSYTAAVCSCWGQCVCVCGGVDFEAQTPQNIKVRESSLGNPSPCVYLNCRPTYGIRLKTWFTNPTKVQLF